VRQLLAAIAFIGTQFLEGFIRQYAPQHLANGGQLKADQANDQRTPNVLHQNHIHNTETTTRIGILN
ncbi:hypothetical protein QN398_28175, partial [Pseudomonas sp. CCC2.2]|nr:hypothetical protein [Pseudomonas sp. CCC2.2]